MDQQEWKKINDIVDVALDIREEERDTYIEEQCGDDKRLKSEVTKLLESIEQSDTENFLENTEDFPGHLAADFSNEEQETASSLIGETIDQYTISDLIGHGGMGSVFLAERADNAYDRPIAIKIMRQGMDTPSNVARFERERNILANLDHPNIARLLDGGVTKAGLPYLVMEYVEGASLLKYCDENRLNIEERLTLFQDVCQAVKHAHTNATIHRDLKPSNILVTDEGNVKVLDFGIAKLMEPEDPQSALHQTQTGARMLTLGYAAPEQLESKAITTATDSYSLGILLYELLTGVHPFEMDDKDLTEIEQIIRNEEPNLPSEKFLGLPKTTQKKLARKRNITTAAFVKQLEGDLDAIVMKALRKEPKARYNSAEQLLEDLERREQNLPVIARENTIKYNASKFLSRHKTSIAVAAGFLLLIIGFSVFYTWQITEERNKAQIEAKKAEEVTEFLTQLFESNNPAVSGGQTLTAKDLLERGKKRIGNIENPAINANMLLVLGEAYHDLGFQDTAEVILDKAIEKNRNVFGFKSSETAEALYQRGNTEQQNFDVALPYYRKAYHIKSDLFGENSHEAAEVAEKLAVSMRNVGKLDSAEYYSRKAFSFYSQNKATSSDNDLIDAKATLAYILREQKKYQESEKLYLEVISKTEQENLSDGKKLSLSAYYNNLAFIYRDLKRYRDSELYLRKSLKINEEIRGKGHPITSNVRSNLYTNLLADQSKPDSALKLLLENLRYTKQKYSETHWRTASQYESVGKFWLKQGKYDKAQSYFEKSTTIFGKALNPEHIWTSCSRLDLAATLYFQGKNKKAHSVFELGLTNLQKAKPDFRPLNKGQIQDAIKVFKNKSSTQYQEQIEALGNLLGEKTDTE